MTTISEPNPDIRKVLIGKQELREITIMPLSISDQFKLSDLINRTLQYLIDAAQRDDAAFVAFMVDLIRGNLGRILDMATNAKPPGRIKRLFKSKKSLVSDITNAQALEIAEIIYEINYEEILKKVPRLLKEKKESLPEPLRRRFQSS